MQKRWFKQLGALITLGLFSLALGILYHKLKQYHVHDIVAELSRIHATALMLGVGLVIVNYLALSLYDLLGLHYIRKRLPFWRVMLGSFVGYVFSNNTTIVGGSAARYRIYSSMGMTAGEVARLVLFCTSTFWLGVFSYKHVEYSDALWWRFAFQADAPRFLRAMVGSVGVFFCFGLVRLFRPKMQKITPLEQAELESLVPLVQACPQTNAHLALLGDKRFLFNDVHDTFIMYGIEGRSWIALGDPIGPRENWDELLWDFRELLLWGKTQGYQWFNFGMAPLSGLEDHDLAPFWSQAGAFVFRVGEHFYNFQGLRAYKDKYQPTWRPRYLACPRGLALPQVLTHLVTLISGSLRGAIMK